jgi:hypothetical protein
VAVAASITLALIGSWLIWRALGAGPGYENPYRDMNAAYALKVQDGLKPDWVCEDEQEFRDAFVKEFNHPLLLGLDRLPVGVEVVGLSYSNTISRRTIIVLARVNEKPVLVFVDRAGADKIAHEASDGLHLFRQSLGGLALYELTPWEYPALLDRFSLPVQGSNRVR